jgi:hypothetical protein
MGGLDIGLFEQLPNKCCPFGAVVIEGFVGPFAGDQDATSGDAEVFGFVGFALALPRGYRVSGSFGLDSIEGPHWAPR